MILCYLYHNYSVYKSIGVVVDDTASIEYGSANYDINKIVKEVEGDIVSIKKDVDINTLGEQEVVLEVKKDNSAAERIKFDEAKVRYCTCDTAPLRYSIGATVVLAESGAMVRPFTSKGRGKTFCVHINK